MYKRLGKLSIVVALFILILAPEVYAKQGPYIGVDLVYNNIDGDDIEENIVAADLDPGLGFDIKVGYTFSTPISIELEWGASGHDIDSSDAGFGFFVLALRYSFMTDQPMNPYIRFGLGAYALVIEDVFDPGTGLTDDLELTGGGFDIGIGFDYFVSENVSLGAGLTQRFIEYDEVDYLIYDLAEDVEANTTSLNFSFKYHF